MMIHIMKSNGGGRLPGWHCIIPGRLLEKAAMLALHHGVTGAWRDP